MSKVKAKWIVDGVKVEHLMHIWDDAWPYLLQAVRRVGMMNEAQAEAHVLSTLYRKEQQLWVGWNVEKNTCSGAVTTEILDDEKHPGMRFLHIPLCGAEGWNEWGDAMWKLLKTWGIHHGCTHAIVCGRKGWKRLYGFVDCGTAPDGRPLYVRKLKD